MHRAILMLVEAHARVSDVAPVLITRVLEALVNGITEVALGCFQQIPKYGTGGMLTVRYAPSHETALKLTKDRPRLRSSSSINRSISMSLHKPTTLFPRSTTPSRKRTGGRRARMTSIANLIRSKSYSAIVGRPRGWRHCASSQERSRRTSA